MRFKTTGFQRPDATTAMWRVAFADGHLDKYEENIIRRVADLLHIRHSEYIRCKANAKDAN